MAGLHVNTAAFSLIVFAQVAGQHAPSSYLCIPDYSTGYAVDRAYNWRPTQFDVQGTKYILSMRDNRWFWADFGKEPHDPLSACENFNEQGFLNCRFFESDVLFNRKTLRFQVVHAYGYVTDDTSMDRERPPTPSYQIGRCTPL